LGFVILSVTRSGSTTMGLLMKAHPDVKEVIWEPFSHIKRGDFDQIEKSYGPYDGIKIMTHRVRFDALTDWLKKENMSLIVLFRKNILKMAISQLLAEETEWGTHLLSKNYQDYKTMKFGEIPFAKVIWQVKSLRKKMGQLERWANSVDHCHICYEDFYLQGGWKETLPKIYEFCGLTPVITPHARRLMKTQRVNDERIYLNIDNVYEIERKFGSDKTGWLFNGPPLFL